MTVSAGDLFALDTDTLGAHLAELPEWPFGPVRLTRINSGITNVNYLAHTADGPVFLKVPGAGTSAFIDWEISTEAAKVAAAQGVAPAVLYYDAATGVQVSEFLEGYRSAGATEFSDMTKVTQVFSMYRQLHDGPLLSTTKTLFDMIDEHRRQLAEAGAALLPYQQEVLERWAPIQDAYVAAGLDLVPGHNDMLPSNYMFNDAGDLKLIDFDYAANTDRFYEIGGIIRLFGFPPAVESALVSAYLGREADSAAVARVYLSGIGAAVKWGLWGLYNGHVRDVDFDYDKYGAGMLAAAHRWLGEERTAWAVSRL